MSTTAQRLLQWHRSQLGYQETPVNLTKYGVWYGWNGVPWCDIYQSYGGAAVGAADIIGHFAGTQAHAAWFIDQGRWGHSARVGALAFYGVAGGTSVSDIDHIGIVEAAYGSMDFLAIEGNSNPFGSSNGYEVCRVHRRSRVIGFGYPKYAAAASAPPHMQPVLYMGERGASVKFLQNKLHITADGIFGSQTRAAVIAFQKSKKLVADGVVGPKTWSALG